MEKEEVIKKKDSSDVLFEMEIEMLTIENKYLNELLRKKDDYIEKLKAIITDLTKSQ